MGNTANGYALLYKHPIMVRSTLRRFLPQEIVHQFDLRTLRSVPTGYVAENLRDRHGDAVWSVKRRDGSEAYIYLLLEFQSSDDPFMALRVLVYTSLLLQDHIRERGLGRGDLLPPVFAITLYNGPRAWRSPLGVRELIESVPSALEPYQPLMSYFLLDVGALDSKILKPTEDPASCLFAFEQSRFPEEVKRLVGLLDRQLNDEQYRVLRRDFASWLSGDYLPRRLPNVEIPEMAELKEVEEMLESRIPNWPAQWRQEGESRILRRQAEQKFGPLNETVLQRFTSADEDRLLAWSTRLLTAKRIEDVFGDS